MLSIIKKLVLFSLNSLGYGIFKKNSHQIYIERIINEKNQTKKIKLFFNNNLKSSVFEE